MLIGYARVSTEDQDPGLQIAELERFGCERIYVDHASGKDLKRPEWRKCRRDLRDGDTLVIWKLDRLARSVKHLTDLSEEFDEQGIQLVVLTQGLDTRTVAGRFLFNILAAVAEMERGLNSERTKAGMERRKEQGIVMGANPAITPTIWKAAKAVIAEFDERKEPLSNYELKRQMDALGHRLAVATWKKWRERLNDETEYPVEWAAKLAQSKRLQKQRGQKPKRG